jgi:hypothetical protein
MIESINYQWERHRFFFFGFLQAPLLQVLRCEQQRRLQLLMKAGLQQVCICGVLLPGFKSA